MNHPYSIPFLLLGLAPLSSLAQFTGSGDDHFTCKNNDLELLAPLHHNDPVRLQQMKDAQDALDAFTVDFAAGYNADERGGTQYTIPVVFHIIHDGGPENISDEQVEDAVRILNDDYNKLNDDWDDVQSEFLAIVSDVGINFRLAEIDPDGNCTSGITRTESVLTYDGTQDMKDLIQWPRNKYLNVWVAASADGAAGYTYTPGAVANAWSASGDGIVLLHTYCGSIGTSQISHSRVLTHEVGHWINLRHCWGPTNNPGLPENCDEDDLVSDTPNTEGWQSCNLAGATCGSFLDNVENYMEYSYCCKMFTSGQKTRMLAALNSGTAQRNQLWQASNLAATGTDGADILCAADWNSDHTTICSGSQVTFNDMSYHGVTTWDWTFDGGSPATSSDENPVVTYDTPGSYAVTLVAGNGMDNVTLTRNGYVTVLPAIGAADPYSEDFEATTAIPDAEWFVYDPDLEEAFELFSGAGYSGTKSVRVRNYYNDAGDIDEMLSSTMDMSAASDIVLTFRYAFAKRHADDDDVLRVYGSLNCGETWSLRKQIRASNDLPTVPDQTAQFTPDDAGDWGFAQIDNFIPAYNVSNFRFKLQFENAGGNNLYIDDINISGSPVGLEEVMVHGAGMTVVPNPVAGEADLFLTLQEAGRTRIDLLDVLGRTIAILNDGDLSAGDHRIVIPARGLETGLYFVRLHQGAITRTVRFTVK